MRKHFLFLLLVICARQLVFSNNKLFGEELSSELLSHLYLNVSIGNQFYDCLSPDYDFVRASTNYYSSYESKTLSYYFDQIFADVKIEYRFFEEKLWLSSGLRYSNLLSSLGKYAYYENSSDYFYLTTNNDENTSNFYRVQNIDYSAHYLGLPIELRYSPFSLRFIRVFFKAGTEFNFLFQENKSVDFKTTEMENYEGDILDLFDSSPGLYGSVYLGAGIHLGRPGKTGFRLEANFPVFPFCSGSFGLVEPVFGGGAEFSIVFPLKF